MRAGNVETCSVTSIAQDGSMLKAVPRGHRRWLRALTLTRRVAWSTQWPFVP